MDIRVHHADLVDVSGTQTWAVLTEIDRGNGPEMVGHIFPADTLEWRAAEYGIDPADRATLLEVVLYEPYLPDVASEDHPLFASDTVAGARAAHLARIASVKAGGKARGLTGRSTQRAVDVTKHRVLLDSGVEDPLAVIGRESPIDPEFLAVKAQHVGRQRDAHRAHQAAAPTTAASRDRGSATDFAEALLGPPRPIAEEKTA
jgi:hypothetical protein